MLSRSHTNKPTVQSSWLPFYISLSAFNFVCCLWHTDRMRTRTELLQSTKTPASSYFANLLFNIFVARSDDMAVKISPIDLSHFRKQFCPGTQINQARVFCLSCTHSLCLGLYVRYFSVTGICKPFFPNSVFPQLRISFCSLDLT